MPQHRDNSISATRRSAAERLISHVAVVLDEAEPPEFVHEGIDARARRADHVGERFLAEPDDDRSGSLSSPKFASSSSARARRFSLELNS